MPRQFGIHGPIRNINTPYMDWCCFVQNSERFNVEYFRKNSKIENTARSALTFCIVVLQLSSRHRRLQYLMASSSAVVCLSFRIFSRPRIARSRDLSSVLGRRSLRCSREELAVASISWYLLTLDPLIQHFWNWNIWEIIIRYNLNQSN